MATAPQDRLDAVTNPDNLKWGRRRIGSGATVTYSFLSSIPGYYDDLIPLGAEDPSNNFSAFTTAQRDAVRDILQMYSEIANITFIEDSTGVGDMTFGNHSMGEGVGAYAYYPSLERKYDPQIAPLSGDIWVNADREANFTPVEGEWSHLTLIHEIGHALGLKHPGDYNAGGGGTPGPYLPENEDSHQYSVMSYHSHPEYGRDESPVTPMLYDIAAIQRLYGANMTTRTGNDTYSFSTETELKAIWDAGGWDTFDASNHSQSVQINLGDGQFSSIGGINNIAIAYGATIEAARGGSGDDTLTGNDVDNDLFGGAGNDTLYGNDGVDWLYGEDGDDILYGGAGNDDLYGGNGNDTLVGGDGADYLDGGAGNDIYEYGNLSSGSSVTIVDSEGFDRVIVTDSGDSLMAGLDDGALEFTFSNGSTLSLDSAIEEVQIDTNRNGEAGFYLLSSENISLLVQAISGFGAAGAVSSAMATGMQAASGAHEVILASSWHSRAA